MIKRKTIALQLNDWWTIEPWACTRPAWQRWSNRLGQLKRCIRCSSSHNRAHASTSSFSLYIWKIMLHGYLVNWSITFSGCTIMVSFPHLMPFEGVYIMFGSVVSYLPLMAQLCPRLTPVPAWMWWIECEQEQEGNTEREREQLPLKALQSCNACRFSTLPFSVSVSFDSSRLSTQNPFFFSPNLSRLFSVFSFPYPGFVLKLYLKKKEKNVRCSRQLALKPEFIPMYSC